MSDFSRKYGASPSFKWYNSSIMNEGDVTIVNFRSASHTSEYWAARSYLPFDNIIISNKSGADLEFYPNQNEKDIYSIRDGTEIILDKNKIESYDSWKLKIDSGTATAKGIIITCSRESINADGLITGLFKRLLGVN